MVAVMVVHGGRGGRGSDGRGGRVVMLVAVAFSVAGLRSGICR